MQHQFSITFCAKNENSCALQVSFHIQFKDVNNAEN